MTKRLAHYFRVIEAAVLIAIARALIATPPFRMWSPLLGRIGTHPFLGEVLDRETMVALLEDWPDRTDWAA